MVVGNYVLLVYGDLYDSSFRRTKNRFKRFHDASTACTFEQSRVWNPNVLIKEFHLSYALTFIVLKTFSLRNYRCSGLSSRYEQLIHLILSFI
jgi:hypothetical protein